MSFFFLVGSSDCFNKPLHHGRRVLIFLFFYLLSAAELLPPKPATWEKSPEKLASEQAEAASVEGGSSSTGVAGKRKRGYDAGSVAASKRASVSAIGMR